MARQDFARLFCGKFLVGDRQQQRPLPFRQKARHLGFSATHHSRDSHAAHPAGCGVVGVPFPTRRLADNAVAVPSQLSEMHGKRNARQPRRGRRPASFADGKFIFYFKRERDGGFDFCVQNLAIGGQNQVVFKLPANFLIAPAGNDRVIPCFGGTDLQ